MTATALSTLDLPLLIEPSQLKENLENEQIILVDLSTAENYAKYHIPGAHSLNYADIVHIQKPVMGLIPDESQLANCLGQLGATPNSHIVAYDDEGGGKAARLLWTLDLLGHQHYSLLNGGIFSWANEGLPTDAKPIQIQPTTYPINLNLTNAADKNYILSKLNSDETLFLDTRSPEEYKGTKCYAARGGHIPGAIHLDWINTIDQNNSYRLKTKEELINLFTALEITKDKEIICYCQTHHRSSHTYIVLKYLGFDKIKGYPGAWSDWGNDPATPVES